MKKQHPSRYQAYLLRCWQEGEPGSNTCTWRFSLEAVQDSRRHGFADLESLLAFLQQLTQPESQTDAFSVS